MHRNLIGSLRRCSEACDWPAGVGNWQVWGRNCETGGREKGGRGFTMCVLLLLWTKREREHSTGLDRVSDGVDRQ